MYLSKTFLGILLGAFCSNMWWLTVKFPSPIFALSAVVSSFGIIGWIIYESTKLFEKIDE